MRTQQEEGQGSLFEGFASGKQARKDNVSRGDDLPPRSGCVRVPSSEVAQAPSNVRNWSSLIGRICSFTPNPDSISGCLPSENQVRYCGAVLRVEAAPDYKGLPTCLATVRGRSGKQATINFTECYATMHDSWREAERNT